MSKSKIIPTRVNDVYLEMYVCRGGCPGGWTAATPGPGLAYQAPGGGEKVEWDVRGQVSEPSLKRVRELEKEREREGERERERE